MKRCWPLSVSADRIALPAMRTFALLVRHGVTDRSGNEKFYEVYPAGSLSRWSLTNRGYKKNTDDHEQARKSILDRLRKAMPWLVVPEACAATGDGLDALIVKMRPAALDRVRQQNLERAIGCPKVYIGTNVTRPAGSGLLTTCPVRGAFNSPCRSTIARKVGPSAVTVKLRFPNTPYAFPVFGLTYAVTVCGSNPSDHAAPVGSLGTVNDTQSTTAGVPLPELDGSRMTPSTLPPNSPVTIPR